jgi:hypothetical protein
MTLRTVNLIEIHEPLSLEHLVPLALLSWQGNYYKHLEYSQLKGGSRSQAKACAAENGTLMVSVRYNVVDNLSFVTASISSQNIPLTIERAIKK